MKHFQFLQRTKSLKRQSPVSVMGLLIAVSALLITFSAPQRSIACGGLFCDNTLPVNQAAERILFAADQAEEMMHMHVQISYQGPPDDFSWLLPVPPGTTFGLSRNALFTELDNRYAPTFRLNRIEAEYCPRSDRDGDLATFATAERAEGQAIDDEVQITSQSQVGPYDQVTLNADNVQALITWLEDNGYQVPPGSEETLEPYVGTYEFLAIKLSSGQDSGDIQPISLKYLGDLATIPIRPTSVAAEPDMGVIVHLLGSSRGVPSNYQHVELNLAALDWFNAPSHYAQLVSHAVDEADGGHAFVTDFAGVHSFPTQEITPVISPNLVLAMGEVRNSEALYEVLIRLLSESLHPDLNQTLIGSLPFDRDQNQRLIELALVEAPISNVEVSSLIYDEAGESITIDGAFIAEALNTYNRAGQDIQRLFSVNSYLTRLYTTLSFDEMDQDPSFSFNPDLSEIPRERVADLYLSCDGSFDYLVTPEGYEVDLSGEPMFDQVERQDGATVRGENVIGAAVIFRSMSAGQPEIVTDQRSELSDIYRRPAVNTEDFFGCDQRSQISRHLIFLFTLLVGLTYSSRRRRDQNS